MKRRLFLGIDVSTTSAKALLIDEAGGIAASAATPLSISTPRPLWSEQDPYAYPLARGAWVGLTSRHRREHLTRALLEGVAFGLKDSFGLLAAAGLEPVRQVRVAGCGAQSPLWRQILADVLGVELVTVTTPEGAAYGAALLAGVGAGTWRDVSSACLATIQPGATTVPDERLGAVYEEAYTVYKGLYPALKETNNALSALETEDTATPPAR